MSEGRRERSERRPSMMRAGAQATRELLGVSSERRPSMMRAGAQATRELR
ncbi:hypothetical protein [Halomicrobium katesii]|nr:hypothetical protein [Halomicrobium katesii]